MSRLVPGTGSIWPLGFGLAGLTAVVLGVLRDPAQGFGGLLTASVFGISVSLGAAIFIAIQGASGARWWDRLRPVASLVAGTHPVPALTLGVTLLLGFGALYPWAQPGALQASHVLSQKAAWLTAPLFLAREVAILVIWLLLIGLLRNRLARLTGESFSVDGKRFARASVAFLLVLGPTLSVYSWDTTMSLQPEWFSTMYAVYGFAGSFLAGLAAVAVLATYLDERGGLPRPLQAADRHDLGKLLFGFSTFWAYIWFCQYLLIWYSNLPEETPYYAVRHEGGWTALFWLNPVLSWLVPFVVLMPARVKRSPAALGQVAFVVLLGRLLDSWLAVAPALGPVPAFPFEAVGATTLVLAGMGLLLRRLRTGSGAVASHGSGILEVNAAAG